MAIVRRSPSAALSLSVRRGARSLRGLRVPDRVALGALALVTLLAVFGPLLRAA